MAELIETHFTNGFDWLLMHLSVQASYYVTDTTDVTYFSLNNL